MSRTGRGRSGTAWSLPFGATSWPVLQFGPGGERRDGESDLAVHSPLQEKELLTGLGVAEKGAIREPASLGFVDDVDDSAGNPQGQRADAKTHLQHGARLHPRAGGHHLEAGSPMYAPAHEVLDG